MERSTRKHSRKRDAILACLRGTAVHPSADWIYARLKPEIPDLSLGTVYRNLSLFREEGMAQSLGVVNGLERFDADTSPHMHFVCTRCGAVIDVDGAQLPADLPAMGETAGRVSACRVTFSGICHACASDACASDLIEN